MPRVVKVRLLDAPSFLDREYDYSVPVALSDECRPGKPSQARVSCR